MKPVRCYTCGKVLGNKWCTVEKRAADGVPMKQIYDDIGVTRYCCKRTVLASYDTTTNMHEGEGQPSLDEQRQNAVQTPSIPDSVRVVCTSDKYNFLKIM